MAKKTPSEILIEFLERDDLVELMIAELEAIQKEYEDIPEDKDCKKCPYAYEGQCQGMVTPCFDICEGCGPSF